jgi:pilus assembly protein Flp/PilA
VFPGVETTGRGFFPTNHFPSKENEMQKLKNAVTRFITNEEGAALAEYGILIAFIAIVAIIAVTFFGAKISNKFSDIGNHFT